MSPFVLPSGATWRSGLRSGLAVLSALCFGTVDSAGAQAPSITLADALRRASDASIEVRAAASDVAIARGQRTAAGTARYNPQLNAYAGPARGPDTALTSFQVGVSQAIELGGKRGARVAAADRRIEAAEARLARARALAMARARRAFALALLARERAATAFAAESVATVLRTAATDRLQLGAGTQLELNVAAAAAVRERRLRLEAERQAASALFDLSASLGLPPNELPVPEGALPAVPDSLPAEPELIRLALDRRADVAAARADRAAAEAEVRLARALAVPDPEFGIAAGRAEDFRVTLFSVSLPLPLFDRGQGDRAVARAGLDRAALAAGALERQAEREVRDAHQAFMRAREAVRGFDMVAVGALRENLALAAESFEAGKIGLLIFSSVRRDLVDARLAYLDALADLYERYYGVETATQIPPEPAP